MGELLVFGVIVGCLYSISTKMDARVKKLWSYVNGVMAWSFTRRRKLLMWKGKLNGYMASEEDRWLWSAVDGVGFTGKYIYELIEKV